MRPNGAREAVRLQPGLAEKGASPVFSSEQPDSSPPLPVSFRARWEPRSGAPQTRDERGSESAGFGMSREDPPSAAWQIAGQDISDWDP